MTQVIYVDNGSTEPGLIELLGSNEVIDELVLREIRDYSQDEWKGKNEILDRALGKCDVLCFLQDDCQLVSVEGLLSNVRDFYDKKMSHMIIQAQRKTTIRNNLRAPDTTFMLSEKASVPVWTSPITNEKYWESYNFHFNTTGLYDPKIFELIGKYPIGDDLKLTMDGFTSAEDIMDRKVKKITDIFSNTFFHPQVPVFLPIWNDPRGLHALVRGERRHGHYIPPDEKTLLYYSMLSKDELEDTKVKNQALSFADIARPIGWDYPRTPDGDHIKGSKEVIKADGPTCFFDGALETITVEEIPTPNAQDEEYDYLEEW